MMSQGSDQSDTRFDIRPARRQEHGLGGSSEQDSAEDLGLSASNRAVGITLAIGIGMMLLVLMLPYIGGL